MKDIVYGWEPDDVPSWLAAEMAIEPLVRQYGFPPEYWESQPPRRVELYVTLMEMRERVRKQREGLKNGFSGR